MEELIKLYTFLKDNLYLAKEISSLSESDFLKNKEKITIAYALFNETLYCFNRLDKKMLASSDKLMEVSRELLLLEKYLLNSYKEVNAYLTYDFLKQEYSNLLREVEEIVSL